jgi:hypothetical protein
MEGAYVFLRALLEILFSWNILVIPFISLALKEIKNYSKIIVLLLAAVISCSFTLTIVKEHEDMLHPQNINPGFFRNIQLAKATNT